MAKTLTTHDDIPDRPSGVPGPHKLGDAAQEFRWSLIALFVIIALIVAFILDTMY